MNSFVEKAKVAAEEAKVAAGKTKERLGRAADNVGTLKDLSYINATLDYHASLLKELAEKNNLPYLPIDKKKYDTDRKEAKEEQADAVNKAEEERKAAEAEQAEAERKKKEEEETKTPPKRFGFFGGKKTKKKKSIRSIRRPRDAGVKPTSLPSQQLK